MQSNVLNDLAEAKRRWKEKRNAHVEVSVELIHVGTCQLSDPGNTVFLSQTT